MNLSKVYWLLDEVFAKTHPNNWHEVVDLTQRLISIIGNKDLSHEIVNPIESFRKLCAKLEGQSPTTIIDISGWIGHGLKVLFPEAQLVTDFSLSRVLDVSISRSIGHVLNLSQDEIARRAEDLDLSSVLIVDDATISGRTNRIVMDRWRIQPENTTHASLLMNTGSFPQVRRAPKKEGATTLLEGLGSRVIYGDSIITPNDDTEHVIDIFDHPNLEAGFSSAMRLQYLVESSGSYSEGLRHFMATDELGGELFPQQISKADIEQLSTEGRFIPFQDYTLTETSIYSRSPFLWAFDEFWGKIDRVAVHERRSEIAPILHRLRTLQTDQEGVMEVKNALKREVGSVATREGRINKGERKI